MIRFSEVNLRDCWTNKAETMTCDGSDSLMICKCANSDFCNCHSNPDLNGEKCPYPNSANATLYNSVMLLLSLQLLMIAVFPRI